MKSNVLIILALEILFERGSCQAISGHICVTSAVMPRPSLPPVVIDDLSNCCGGFDDELSQSLDLDATQG